MIRLRNHPEIQNTVDAKRKGSKKCFKFMEAGLSRGDSWVACLYFSIASHQLQVASDKATTSPREECWRFIFLCHGPQAARYRLNASADLFELLLHGKLQRWQLKTVLYIVSITSPSRYCSQNVVIMFHWVYTYLQTLQVLHIKYIQLFLCRSYLTKVIF